MAYWLAGSLADEACLTDELNDSRVMSHSSGNDATPPATATIPATMAPLVSLSLPVEADAYRPSALSPMCRAAHQSATGIVSGDLIWLPLPSASTANVMRKAKSLDRACSIPDRV
jgi:hypothetical protein